MNTYNEETNIVLSKADSCKNWIEALTEEIEQVNEEQVVVELARIEAVKDYVSTQSQRRENAAKHLASMKEIRKKKQKITEEIEAAKELEMKLAITESNIQKFQNELKEEDGSCSLFLLMESLTKVLEAKKKELSSIKEETFQCMDFMDDIRKELRCVTEAMSRLKKKEERSKFKTHNLESKLLRSKAKLEDIVEARDKAKSTVSNFTNKLEQLKSEAETAKKERSVVSDEIAAIKDETQRRKKETARAKERLHAARQDLKAVKSSEAKAFENLRAIIEHTTKSRTLISRNNSTIRISKFEYEYLEGHADDAKDIANKKIDAARAWTKAFRASERQNQMKIENLRRELRDLKVEEEEREICETGNSKNEKNTVKDSFRLKQETGLDRLKNKRPISSKFKDEGFKMTPTRQARARRLASPVVARCTPRSTPIMVRRRRKVVRNLVNFFSVKSIRK